MKKLYIAVSVGVLALFGLAFWKNSKSYIHRSRNWRLVKSAIDCSLVVLAALYLPALLVGWTVMWLTRSLNRRGIQITAAVVLGILFSSIGGVALEVLCVLGIFAVDLLTGYQGCYGWWKVGPPETFMPKFVEAKYDAFTD
jgi:hypothetical protein